VITDGVDGRLVPPEQPELWAHAAADLLDDAAQRGRLADAGRATARRFAPGDYAEALVDVWASASATGGR
jgi:glycosyltransferase involved in cell wall biosynthesis